MRLSHFSEEPSIPVVEPRPGRVPVERRAVASEARSFGERLVGPRPGRTC